MAIIFPGTAYSGAVLLPRVSPQALRQESGSEYRTDAAVTSPQKNPCKNPGTCGLPEIETTGGMGHRTRP